MRAFLLFLCFIPFSYAQASSPELLVFASDRQGHPARGMCFFSNSRFVPHPQGVLVRFTCLGGRELENELWIVGKKTQLLVKSEATLLKDPVVVGEEIFVLEYSEFETTALWEIGPAGKLRHALPREYRMTHLHDLAQRGPGLSFRFTNNATKEHGEGQFAAGLFQKLPARQVAFFHPAVSSESVHLQKLILPSPLVGPRPEVVELRVAPDFAPEVVLQDVNADPSSPYTHLRNQLSVQGQHWALVASTGRGFVLIKGEGRDFAAHALPEFRDLDYFQGALNSRGEYVFRATHVDGRRGLWRWSGGQTELLLTAGEPITVGSEELLTSSRFMFFNAPVVNALDELLVGVGLSDPESRRDIGQGLIRIRP